MHFRVASTWQSVRSTDCLDVIDPTFDILFIAAEIAPVVRRRFLLQDGVIELCFVGEKSLESVKWTADASLNWTGYVVWRD